MDSLVISKIGVDVLEQFAKPTLLDFFLKYVLEEELVHLEVDLKYYPEGTCNKTIDPIVLPKPSREDSVYARLSQPEVLEALAKESLDFFLKHFSEEELSFIEVEVKYLPGNKDDNIFEPLIIAQLRCYAGPGPGCPVNQHWGHG